MENISQKSSKLNKTKCKIRISNEPSTMDVYLDLKDFKVLEESRTEIKGRYLDNYITIIKENGKSYNF